MIKRTLFSVITLFTVCLASAQSPQKAKALLDEVYNKVMAYENIEIAFKYALENTDANTKSETQGKAFLAGDKYSVDLFGAKQLYDGSMVYTIVPDNEEVTIEKPTEGENTVTPSKMLTFYKEGHTYAWDILQNVQGRKIQFVKLTPIDTNTEIKNILLGIDAETKHIYKLIETGKNGTKTTITVNSFKTNQPLSKSLFTFDEAKYKEEGYYIIKN